MTLNPFKPSDEPRQPLRGLLISSGLTALGLYGYFVVSLEPAALIYFFIVMPATLAFVIVVNVALSLSVYAVLNSFRMLSLGAFVLATAAVYSILSGSLVLSGMPPRTPEKALWFAMAYGTTFLPMTILFWVFSRPAESASAARDALDVYGTSPDRLDGWKLDLRT